LLGEKCEGKKNAKTTTTGGKKREKKARILAGGGKNLNQKKKAENVQNQRGLMKRMIKLRPLGKKKRNRGVAHVEKF